jgi:hypothetical protein
MFVVMLSSSAASLVSPEDDSTKFSYEALCQCREKALDFFYAKKGVKNLKLALVYNKMFIAGSQNLHKKMTELETAVENKVREDGHFCDCTHTPNLEMSQLVDSIINSNECEDKYGDKHIIDLKELYLAASENIAIYHNYWWSQRNTGLTSPMLPMVRFWQRFAQLLSEKIRVE